MSFRCSHSSLCCIKDGKFLYFVAIHLENSIFGQFCRLYYPLKSEWERNQNALVVIIVVVFFCQASFYSFESTTLKGLRRLNFLPALISVHCPRAKFSIRIAKGIEKPFLQANDDKKGCIYFETVEKGKDFCGEHKKGGHNPSLTSLICTFSKFFHKRAQNYCKIFQQTATFCAHFLLNNYFLVLTSMTMYCARYVELNFILPTWHFLYARLFINFYSLLWQKSSLWQKIFFN